MRISVLIVEDDPITAQDISETLEGFGMHISDVVRSGEEALSLIQVNKPDVILMDINLEGELDGVGTVLELNKTDAIPVIYLTANSDKVTVGRAFQTNPSAFIIKPFDETNIIYAIELAFNNHLNRVFEAENLDLENADSIYLKNAGKYEKVGLEEILYVQADGSYSHIITACKKYSSSHNLNFVWKKLTHPNFIRLHRSYVVNLNNVTSFDGDFVYFNETYIPYSKNHRDDLMKRLKRMS